MMTLYSGTTCPFSQRCRIVLYEKGMDFQIIDVDLYNKPEDLAVMNPYNRTPVLVERDLILYESNIINEYIDDRFPHPQLMPADPVMRARARLMLFNMEVELFSQIESLESGKEKQVERARQQAFGARMLDADVPVLTGRVVAAHEQVAAGLDTEVGIRPQLLDRQIDGQAFGHRIQIEHQRSAQRDRAGAAIEPHIVKIAAAGADV